MNHVEPGHVKRDEFGTRGYIRATIFHKPVEYIGLSEWICDGEQPPHVMSIYNFERIKAQQEGK